MDQILNNLSEIVNEWRMNFAEAIPFIIVGVVIFVLSLFLAKILSKSIRKTMGARGADKEIIILVSRLIRWAVIGFGILVAFQQAGTDVTAFLTGLGVLGFTVGFALKDVSSNFVAGILLLWQQPFKIGDTIEIGDYIGEVRKINLRDTEMFSVNGLSIRIPNSEIFTNSITNYTQTDRRRISLSIGVSYETNLLEAQETAINAIKDIDGILQDPAPSLIFHDFGGTTIDGTLYYWADMNGIGYLSAQDSVLQKIKLAFSEAEIDMPFPTQKIIVDRV